MKPTYRIVKDLILFIVFSRLIVKLFKPSINCLYQNALYYVWTKLLRLSIFDVLIWTDYANMYNVYFYNWYTHDWTFECLCDVIDNYHIHYSYFLSHNINSSIKGRIGYCMVFMILLEGFGTHVSEKLYFEACNASKLNLWLKKWYILAFKGDTNSN